MLILGRKVGEKVMIGDNIVVSICGVHGTQIRLGFEVPKEIEVHREEIYDKIQKQTKKPITD